MRAKLVHPLTRLGRLELQAVWFGSLILAGLAGCGEATTGPGSAAGSFSGTPYPVQGQVLLSSGKPLDGGRVFFLPKDPSRQVATGDIGSDGNFQLKLADGTEGAQEGEYKVRIAPGVAALKKTKGGLVEPRSLPFPAKYADEDGDTGLTATVKAEPTRLAPFRLTADQKRAASR